MATKHSKIDYTFPASALRDGLPRTITAFETATPGLVVTPWDIDASPSPHAKAWAVTHIPTGTKVTHSATRLTRRVAFLAAGALGGAFDWTSPCATPAAIAAAATALREANVFVWLRSMLQ